LGECDGEAAAQGGDQVWDVVLGLDRWGLGGSNRRER